MALSHRALQPDRARRDPACAALQRDPKPRRPGAVIGAGTRGDQFAVLHHSQRIAADRHSFAPSARCSFTHRST
jgi:hypothetical protein